VSFNSDAVLPVGLQDVTGKLAEKRHTARAAFLNAATTAGFSLTIPPLLEFADSSRDANAFMVMDPHSRAPMVLRSDITPQVMRLAATLLRDAPRPLKLCYAGDVLRSAGTALRPERQFLQLGAEIFGDTPAKALPAVLTLLSAVFARWGLPVTVDICFPGWLRGELKRLDAETAEAALKRKDFSALPAAVKTLAKQLAGHTDLSSIPSVFDTDTKALLAVIKNLNLPGLTFTTDWLELDGFSFQTGPCFTIFNPAISGEIGRGGVYQTATNNEHAAGFSVYLDPLLPYLGASSA
jgi:ATP phosphoribosyltransferase regulatory subunit